MMKHFLLKERDAVPDDQVLLAPLGGFARRRGEYGRHAAIKRVEVLEACAGDPRGSGNPSTAGV